MTCRKGLENLFKGYANSEPPLEGEALLQVIREDISHMQFVHPDIVISYEIYKRIRIFLQEKKINIPQKKNPASLLPEGLSQQFGAKMT